MWRIKGWIIPIAVLIILLATIALTIYQQTSSGNPWDFDGRNKAGSWNFLTDKD